MPFLSNLSEYISSFIDQKHSLGYSYIVSEYILKSFDRLCFEQFPEANTITREIAEVWAQRRDNEQVCTFINRMAPIRELAKYMNRLNIDAYVIPGEMLPKWKDIHKYHVLTIKELQLFFNAADTFTSNKCHTLNMLAMSVIFRLMYCCGLRPNEARKIKTADINFSTGELQIPESKGHKERVVVISDDLLCVCEKYYQELSKYYPCSIYFFRGYTDRPFASRTINEWFLKCSKKSGIAEEYSENLRPYDLRHNFATHKINEWIENGIDVEVNMPYLSAYMGHAKYADTAYYIHLSTEQFKYGLFDRFEQLIPEVTYEN